MTETLTTEKRDQVRLFVNSHHPLIAVETAEEARAEQLLGAVAIVAYASRRVERAS